jgi:hypothetical protein
MAAFEAQGFGRLGDVAAMAVELGQHLFALEGKHPLGQALRAFTFWSSYSARAECRQRHGHISGGHFVAGEQEQSFDHVAQLANVAGPCVVLERIDCSGREGDGFPSILRADLEDEVLDEGGQIFGAAAQRR